MVAMCGYYFIDKLLNLLMPDNFWHQNAFFDNLLNIEGR